MFHQFQKEKKSGASFTEFFNNYFKSRQQEVQSSFANDKLWKEIVYLVEFGVRKEIIFFDVNSQNFYLRKSYSGKSKESLNLIVEGIESRLFFIESNRLHFFLDAVLLLPEDFKLNWFDTIYAWKPPELPN